MNPDIELFHFINDRVGAIGLVDWIARGLVNDFIVPTLLSLAAVWLWFAGPTPEAQVANRRAVAFIALGLLFANAFMRDLAYVYFRPRPFASEAVKLLFYRPSVSSFPSVPIAVAFSFAAGAWRADRRLGFLLSALGALYGLSRVYAGVHFPSDVIAGAVIGVGTVCLLDRLKWFFIPLADAAIRVARYIGFA